jgi:phosphatidylglycerophosphatase A
LAPWSLPLAALLRAYANAAYLAAVAAAYVAGIWAAGRRRDLGVGDAGLSCGMRSLRFSWCYFCRVGPNARAFAFLLFRLFDIVKPPPARFIDREWHGGFGVMADDIVAAFYALIVLALWQRVIG